MINKILQIIERKTFIYYNDVNNQTLYVPRFIYEECLFNSIEMTSKPKIIMEKNHYSITRKQLQELEEKTYYKGIEKKLYLKKENPSPKLTNTIFAYKDGNTNIIYLPLEYAKQTSGNTKTIMNKKCCVVHERDLEKIYNKTIIVVTVFLKPEEIEDVLICRIEHHYFIQESVAITFGLSMLDRKRIRVDGVIYIQISREEINLIYIIATKEDRKVHFIEKEIIPKKR